MPTDSKDFGPRLMVVHTQRTKLGFHGVDKTANIQKQRSNKKPIMTFIKRKKDFSLPQGRLFMVSGFNGVGCLGFFGNARG